MGAQSHGARAGSGRRRPGSGGGTGRVPATADEQAGRRGARGPWNVKSDRSVGDAPGSAFWATDPNGFGQVGCVYTAQGFEYEWSGVIVGPDLIARDGRLVTRRTESKDPAFRSRKQLSDFEADRLIRNTYKVLMTRGMRGTVLYSTDPETRAYLASLVQVKRLVETTYEPVVDEATMHG
ncbi:MULTISPECIES: DNA/RNA helicase domain-containing protein [Micromonospora]|uniref:DNA/RNA helicase domain-containing protein n=1 Tax=Micromonospora TaxID=1873 RepID=UPI000AEBCB4C|nr:MULTISPECIES: DNA/RNA helicase domain-containing protein [Micromonospora]